MKNDLKNNKYKSAKIIWLLMLCMSFIAIGVALHNFFIAPNVAIDTYYSDATSFDLYPYSEESRTTPKHIRMETSSLLERVYRIVYTISSTSVPEEIKEQGFVSDLVVIDRITLQKNGLNWFVSRYESTYTESLYPESDKDGFIEALLVDPNIEFLTIIQRESIDEAIEELPDASVAWVEIIEDYYPIKRAPLAGHFHILNKDQSEEILSFVTNCQINETESFIVCVRLDGADQFIVALNVTEGSVKNLLKLGKFKAAYVIHQNKVMYATSENLGIIDISSLMQQILLEYKTLEIESDHSDIPELRFISETSSVMVSLIQSKEAANEVYQTWELDFEGNIEDLGRQTTQV